LPLYSGDVQNLWGLVFVVGCAQVPERAADLAPLLEITRGAAGEVRSVRAADGLYEMQFGGAGNVHLPVGLRIEGVEVLGAGDECYNEEKIGVAVFPAINVHGATPADPSLTNTIEAVLDGPIVSQVRIEFGASYACNGPQQITGETTFTFFPSGRIVRNDLAISPTTTTATGADCTCANDAVATYFFTSFWAFQVDAAGAQVTRAGEPAADVLAEPGACTLYPDRAIAVNFGGATTRYPANGAFTHAFDLVPGDVPQIEPDSKDLTSAIQISNRGGLAPADCDALFAALDDPQVLQVEDAAPQNTNLHGIYEIDSPRPNGVTFRAMAKIPGGFVVNVDLGGVRHLRMLRNGIAAPLPRSQPDVRANRFLFLFEDDLDAGETIRFEPAE
jgi:hypothetical protein